MLDMGRPISRTFMRGLRPVFPASESSSKSELTAPATGA